MLRARPLAAGAAALLLLTVLASFAAAGTIRHDRDQEAYLELAAEYPSVGRIDFSTDSSAYVASGTLIANKWVLTAGHVVDEATSLSFTVGDRTYAGERWVPHPMWDGDLLAGYDIGLVKLDSKVRRVRPARRYRGGDELGIEATIVGYGMTGTGLTGMETFDGFKRAGRNVIDVVTGAHLWQQGLLLCDFDNPDDPADNFFGDPEPVDLEFMVALGDSGGGVFLESRHGPLLAGVNSFLGAWDGGLDADYGDVSGHTRVSAFNLWIDATIAIDKLMDRGRRRNWHKPWAWPGCEAELPVLKDPSVPEPASLWLLSAACLGLIRRRRR